MPQRKGCPARKWKRATQGRFSQKQGRVTVRPLVFASAGGEAGNSSGARRKATALLLAGGRSAGPEVPAGCRRSKTPASSSGQLRRPQSQQPGVEHFPRSKGLVHIIVGTAGKPPPEYPGCRPRTVSIRRGSRGPALPQLPGKGPAPCPSGRFQSQQGPHRASRLPVGPGPPRGWGQTVTRQPFWVRKVVSAPGDGGVIFPQAESSQVPPLRMDFWFQYSGFLPWGAKQNFPRTT